MKNSVMDTPTHKMLDYLEHLWPYVSGFVITLIAGIKLWFYDRKQTRQKLADNSAAIIAIKNDMVTQAELHSCREDVRGDDEKNLDMILVEIKGLHQEMKIESKDNAKQHQDIMKQIIRLHSGDRHEN